MLSRIATLVVLVVLFLNQGNVLSAGEQDFDALDNFEEDFIVAFGDAKSWKVNKDVFECNGKPNGYICTKKSYSNYVLTVEFRYPEQAGNTGILNYVTGEHKIWPACVEVQGHYDRLAQIFAMGGAKGPRSDGDDAARKKARKPHTVWNKFEITSQDGVISAKLNGVLIGEGGPYSVKKGPVGFQSEGAPIHFRNIRIKEQNKVTTVKNEKDDAEMILISGGSFLMGTATEEIDEQFRDTGLPEDWKTHALDEQPRHRRTVEAFYIYKYEVTNEQYQAFVDATDHRSPPHWKGKDFPKDKADHPVVEVSWDDAQAYCRWAGAQLPTEAQWEFAARGAEPDEGKPSRAFPWGNRWDRTLANNASLHAGKELQNAADWKDWYEGDVKSKFPLTSRGGAFPKSVSPFGVQDMAGNAWEWCAEIQAPYPKQNAEDADNKKLRARRGGSWANVALHIRSADRQGAAQDDLNLYTGFRCVKLP